MKHRIWIKRKDRVRQRYWVGSKPRKNYGMALKVNLYDKAYLPTKMEKHEDPIKENLIEEGFDIARTMVHGTSLENAKKIKQQMKLNSGTFLYPGRGGFEDAKVWAENTTKEPRVVVVETLNKIRSNWGEWVTVGKRAEEREGIDTTVHAEVPISKIKILKHTGKGILEEDETQNI